MDTEFISAVATIAKIRLIRSIQKKFSDQVVDWSTAEGDQRIDGVRWAMDRLEEILRDELDG